MKKFFLNCFLVFVMSFAFRVDVMAEEIKEEDIITEYEINALAASENEDGENGVRFDEINNSFSYSPVQNYFFSMAGSHFSYSGANYMLFFRNLVGNGCIYTGGNFIFKNYATDYYPLHDKLYFIDDDGILFLEHGVLNLGYVSVPAVANCIVADDVISGKQAAIYCLNNADKMTDADFLASNNLSDAFVYNSWTEDYKFNPWVDGSKNRSKLDTDFEPSTVSIPIDASGCYIDYLVSDSLYSNFEMRRCYYNGLKGEYTLDDFEKYLPGHSVTYDSILILGVGAYWLDDDTLGIGLTQAPNLLNYDITSWSYTRLGWKHYNTSAAFINNSCADEFDKKLHINASTTGQDISDNTSEKEPNLGFFEGIFQKLGIDGFGQTFQFLDDYIKSMSTNINQFGEMVKVVFQWLPEPVLNLLIFALIAFIAILLIKLILHLL